MIALSRLCRYSASGLTLPEAAARADRAAALRPPYWPKAPSQPAGANGTTAVMVAAITTTSSWCGLLVRAAPTARENHFPRPALTEAASGPFGADHRRPGSKPARIPTRKSEGDTPLMASARSGKSRRGEG